MMSHCMGINLNFIYFWGSFPPSPVGHVISQHGVKYHQYADNTQLRLSMHCTPPTLPRVSQFSPLAPLMPGSGTCRMVCSWTLTSLRLWSLAHQTSYTVHAKSIPSSVSVAGTDLPAADHMTVLGVVLDRRLSFDRHATSVARACNLHAHAIRHIRHLLTTELALTLVCSLIVSRLDYCNAVLHVAPNSSILKLQRVQNTAARIVLQAPRQSPSRFSTTPGTVTLAASSTTHWLQARRPDIQDQIYSNSCIPQLPHQTSEIYTPHPFFNHTAATQTDYQHWLRLPRVPMICSCRLELSEHWYIVL